MRTCLPKKASGYDDDGRAYFEPGATRPLSVVNTDNRLIASAYKKVIEPLANEWVSSMQQGFLEGRSMLLNVVDIDLASMKVAMQHRNGMLILFDFTAAFPSLSRESMFEILQSIGMPPHMLQAIRCLYANNYHTLKLKGQHFPSFLSTGGVRQGCPLSPILFVLCVDVLLRRLRDELPSACIRAFADDNA